MEGEECWRDGGEFWGLFWGHGFIWVVG